MIRRWIGSSSPRTGMRLPGPVRAGRQPCPGMRIVGELGGLVWGSLGAFLLYVFLMWVMSTRAGGAIVLLGLVAGLLIGLGDLGGRRIEAFRGLLAWGLALGPLFLKGVVWPASVAFQRKVEARWAIFVVNLLSWPTGILWVICLVWAYSASPGSGTQGRGTGN